MANYKKAPRNKKELSLQITQVDKGKKQLDAITAGRAVKRISKLFKLHPLALLRIFLK